jgi:integrase
MSFLIDKEVLKPGLIIFRRGDVQHRNWYCRIKIPDERNQPDSKRYIDRYKTVSLKTTDVTTARTMAYDQEVEVRYCLKHDVPVFNRPFSEVAQEYLASQQIKANNGKITHARVKKLKSVINAQLNPYVGSRQVNLIGEELWENYPTHRRETGTGRYGRVSDATIAFEMSAFRAVMMFAARKKYIRSADAFGGRLHLDCVRRDEFTPEEYRKLHTFARGWVKKAPDKNRLWYRTMAYNFVLIMCNTGMRPSEARNLRWRDIEVRQDREGRKLLVLQVRGKKKQRQLVAAPNVAEYLERIREIAIWTEPDDPVFSVRDGKPTGKRADAVAKAGASGAAPATTGPSRNWKAASNLYTAMVRDLLEQSQLLIGQNGKERSTYCFRHTYATFRLGEGVDVYFLAHQMGTSVKMIEQHYGHANAVRNAANILRGLPGWEPVPPATGQAAAQPENVAEPAPAKPAVKRKYRKRAAPAAAAG